MKLTERLVKDIAETIADDLFINGQGEQASRLVLMNDATNTTMGGWSKPAMTARIIKTLKEHMEP